MKMISAMTAASVTLAMALPALAGTSFLGDSLNGTYYFPDSSSVYEDDGVSAVPASFYFATGLPNTTATVSSDQITLSFDAGGGSFTPATFNGVVITDLTASDITGVTLDAGTTVPGFTAADLSFTSNSVSLNLEGLSVPSSSDVVIADVSFGAVPEPATWAMMLIGFGMVGLVTRRRAPVLTAA